MKLNMDLIREILLWCEKNLPEKSGFHTNALEFRGHTPEEIGFHIKLLVDNGYIEAGTIRATGPKPSFLLNNLTLDGYNFLGAIQSDTVWNGMKEAAGKIGIEAIRLAIPILTEIVKKQLLGLP